MTDQIRKKRVISADDPNTADEFAHWHSKLLLSLTGKPRYEEYKNVRELTVTCPPGSYLCY